jgi:nucleoside-diphosphate-sugar epimerase
MHVADVAGAFAALLDSDVEGPVNIGSGTAVPVRDVLEEVARFTGGADLIAFGARALAPDEPATIEASVKRLHDDIGFRPKYDLSQGIAQTVDWWRNVAATKARC